MGSGAGVGTKAAPLSIITKGTGMTMSSEDKADARLLGLANERGKFAIPLGALMDDALINARRRT